MVVSIDLIRVRALDGGFGAIWTDLGHFGRISVLKVTPKWHILGHSGEVEVDALPSADSLATSHDQSHTFMCSVVEKFIYYLELWHFNFD